MDKIKNILVLFFTGCDRGPDTFAPTHARLAASPLCDPSINHHGANLTFRAIIRRFDTRFRQKSKIIGCRIALEPLGQLFRQLMIRRSSHLLQKAQGPQLLTIKPTSWTAKSWLNTPLRDS